MELQCQKPSRQFWKKIDHDYPSNSYRFAGFGTFSPHSLRCKERNPTVDFTSFLPVVIKTQWYLVDWNTATGFRKKRSSFWAKNLKTGRFWLCQTMIFLCDDMFQGCYHWKIYGRWKDVDWDNDRRHEEIFWKNKSVFTDDSFNTESFDVLVA